MKREIKKGVSVIIPTFNRVKFLYPTLLCLANQKVEETLEFEIIIVDSGDDETESVVRMFQNSGKLSIVYKKIKKCKNRSLLRNIGAGVANYSILCFLDNDMLVSPEFVQLHYNSHINNVNSVIIGFRRMLTSFDLTEYGEEALINDYSYLEKLPWYNEDRYGKNCNIQPWRYLYSHGFSIERNNFEEFNLLFGNYWGYEDVELGIRLFLKHLRFIFNENIISYHQAHLEQSKIEQRKDFYNSILLLKMHCCYEVELFLRFKSQFDEYYNCLRNFNSTHIDISDNIIKKFDLILGYVCSFHENRKNKKLRLGVYTGKKNLQCTKILVLNTFFCFPISLQTSILTEAFRISKYIVFSDLDQEKIDLLSDIFMTLGITIRIEHQKNFFIVSKDWEYNSSFFYILLPEIFQIEKRYVYLWLAKKLIEHKKIVKVKDIQSIETNNFNDLSLTKENMNQVFENNKMKMTNRYQFISSSSMLSSNFDIDFPHVKNSYIFYDDDYKNRFPKNRERFYRNCTQVDEISFSYLSFYSVYDEVINYTKGKSNDKYTEQNSQSFCCFMKTGYFEDSIDILIDTFYNYIQLNPQSKLTIFIPDYSKLELDCYPVHNNSSKKNKLFAYLQKYKLDKYQLIEKINHYGLSQNVIIIDKNMDITELIINLDRFYSLVSISKSIILSPEVYIALLLHKKVFINRSSIIIPEIEQSVFLVNTEECLFINDYEFPVSCLNANYFSQSVEKDDLLNKFIIHNHETKLLSDESIKKIIEEGEIQIKNLL